MKIKTSSTLPSTRKIYIDELQRMVRLFDFIAILMSMQELSSLLINQTGLNINLELEFHLVPKKKHQILLSRDFIPFLAKQAILNSSSSPAKFNDLDLINLAYQYGNLETDLDHMNPQSKDAWLWILRATNHQWFYLRLPSMIIARYVYLFNEVFNCDQELKSRVDKLLGLEFFNILKIGTCIWANFSPRPEGFTTSFEKNNYMHTTILQLRPLLTEDNINKFLSIFSINQAQFKEENKKYKLTSKLLKKYEFNPLQRYPVIKTDSRKENEKFIIPSLADFSYACFEGMYYVLLDKLESSDKEILFQKLGNAFEKYIGDLIKHYNLALFSQANLLSEQTYKDKTEVKSVDWLLVSNEYIFQIECKKRKLDNYSKVGLENKNKVGISSFLTSIAKESDKFPKKENHIKDGKVEKVKYSNQKFINVIVYLDEMFAMNEYARNEIKSKMKTRGDNFYILGCYEFEILCQHVSDKHLNLKDALDDLTKKRVEIYSINFLDKIYHDFFDSILNK